MIPQTINEPAMISQANGYAVSQPRQQLCHKPSVPSAIRQSILDRSYAISHPCRQLYGNQYSTAAMLQSIRNIGYTEIHPQHQPSRKPSHATSTCALCAASVRVLDRGYQLQRAVGAGGHALAAAGAVPADYVVHLTRIALYGLERTCLTALVAAVALLDVQ